MGSPSVVRLAPRLLDGAPLRTASSTTRIDGRGKFDEMRPAEVMPTITFALAVHSCSATRTAYGPPMVRGTIPQGTPFSVMARMDVWKHAHDFTGDVRPSSASLSDRSPSKSSTHNG